MKIPRFLLIASLIITLPSCATRRLSDADRNAIRSVHVASIQLPEEPSLPRSGSTGAALIGTLIFLPGGAFIGAGLANLGNDMPAVLGRHLQQQKIDMAAYVTSEVHAHLEKQRFKIVTDPAQADASIEIIVVHYGLMPAALFANEYYPDLMLGGSLVRRSDNKKLWSGSAFLGSDQDALATFERRPREAYMNDRTLLESSFRKVAKTVIAVALRGL